MYYIIYLLFGKNNHTIQKELVYSLLSYKKITDVKARERIQFLIYTEDAICLPEYLNDLPVTFNYLDEKDVQNWIQQANGHALVLKARVMHHFLQTYQSCGMLVDTDTFYIKDPLPLFELVKDGHLVMHLKEYSLTRRPRMYNYFLKKNFRSVGGAEYSILPGFSMWNSGVVGINNDYIGLFPEIIHLVEQIASGTDWPREELKLIEQTAYSYYLQKQEKKIIASDNYIVHYWFFKPARLLLGNFFNYFHGSDNEEFEQIIQKENIEAGEFKALPFELLPSIIIQCMIKYHGLQEYHFDCLPSNTYIGNVLRHNVINQKYAK